MKKLTQLNEWQTLQTHYKTLANQRIADWFIQDPNRFQKFSLSVGDILLDYSKNHLTPETLCLLTNLAEAADLKAKISDLFSGKSINLTENRPALHMALRDTAGTELHVKGHNITKDIQKTLQQMHDFTEQVRNQIWRGSTGKAMTDIVNIGIGGSHLGPETALRALNEYAAPHLRCHFISNIDGTHLHEVLTKINPETSLFIISSKSFSTPETLTNLKTIQAWLSHGLNTTDLSKHRVAVTAAPQKAKAFGIPEQQIFNFWEWVGGRYSVWSAVGLPLALMIGMPHFIAFLNGANAMDQHFQTATFSENMPVLMALVGIWYINFFDAKSHAIIPYSHALNDFPKYLQQADMESNGKSITREGDPIDYTTGPILWGEQGVNGQHAFYQSLHQGKHLVPIDFLLAASYPKKYPHHHNMLVASCLSQSQALMQGKSLEMILSELMSQGFTQEEAKQLAPHKMIPGNRPSNTIFIKKITPFNLGSLFALYEHKIFVQGAIWNINSFDQWGVELGKQLLPPILADLTNHSIGLSYDSSTAGLIYHYKNTREPS
jgi:glucose-6-phosphate isomerase